ncbi:hypothetical protein BH09BAC3_BH09BAC3_29340 [soil metagenome]
MEISKYLLIFLSLIIFLPHTTTAQLITDKDESKLYAQSKQVNQFFRRFNGEEDEKGNRYYQGNKQYRNAKLRKKYLTILFDASNTGMTDALKNEFVNFLLAKPESTVVDFHGGNWFAEVQTLFAVNAKENTVTLFMELEKDHLGYKWTIQKAHADFFKPYFYRDTTKIGRFLHPMSHELDFMNLRKAFLPDSISQFTVKRFVPDHLSLLLYEIKKGNMVFKSVERTKFHFFQIDGWYFEVSDFNRPGYNTGWLISNLVKLKDSSEKELLLNYLHYENR